MNLIIIYFSGTINYSTSWHTSNIKNDAYSLIPEIKGGNNTPVLFNNQATSSTIGQVLRITSNSTGASSKVVVTGGTAKELIFGDSRKLKNGGGGLSGFDSGNIEIYYGSTGGSQLWNQTLGHRLGNCSVTNKTLIVVVDGVTKTVTFDKNYSGGANTSAPAYTNAQILTEINTALGTATATAYNVVQEYYPEWNDLVESRSNESTTDEILAGMGVVFVGSGKVRKAVTGEIPSGIALDDILPSAISGVFDDRGRILKKAILQKTDRFSPLWDGAAPTLSAGDKVRIGSTAGKFIKDATGTTAGICETDLAVNQVVIRF